MIFHDYRALPKSMVKSILKSLKPSVGSMDMNILDIACRNGDMLYAIKKQLSKKGNNTQTCGVDMYEKHIINARERVDQAWISGPTKFSATPATFGFLYINAPLETIEGINEKKRIAEKAKKEMRFLANPFQPSFNTIELYRYHSIRVHETGLYVMVVPKGQIEPGFSTSISRLKNIVISAIEGDDSRVLIIGQNRPNIGKTPVDKVVRDSLIAIGMGKASPIPLTSIPFSYTIPNANLKNFSPNSIKMADTVYLGNKSKACDTFLKQAINIDNSFPQPLTKVNDAHIATALIPAGFLNGEIEIKGETLLLQGSIYQDVVKKSETEVINGSKNGERKISSRKISQSEITMLDLNKSFPILTRIARDQSTIFESDLNDISEMEQETISAGGFS